MRPRKPFGANHPGRLPSTMLKVLAAEMSDPQRLRRGKQYAKDGSVIDIEIAPGVVTCEVQGSRATPYVATIRVTPGDGMPLRRDVTTDCTCPDADWSGTCKHVVASMFTFADELLLEPELLDVWRDREPRVPEAEDETPGPAVQPSRPITRGHLRLVRPDEHDMPRHTLERAPLDRLAEFSSYPDGTELPDEVNVEPLEWLAPADRRLADALNDALGEFRGLDWEN